MQILRSFSCAVLVLGFLIISGDQVAHAQAVAERQEQLTLDIQRSEFSDEYDTLIAGERELIVVTQESTTPITRGAAVILGEAGQGPFNQHGIADLANLLNQYGWVTMVMPAPSSAFFAESKDDEQQQTDSEPAESPPTDSEAPASEPDLGAESPISETQPAMPNPEPVHPKLGQEVISTDQFDQHEQELIAQMQAIVTRTQNYPGFFLVIAQGTTAAWLNKIYSEQQIALPDALIMVSPYWPQRDINSQIPEQLANTMMPVLDIYSQWDNEWSKGTVVARKVAAEKALKMHYRQRELIGQMMDRQQYQLLSKEIYGWLTHMGW